MEQNDRDILLQDVCGRIMHGVKCIYVINNGVYDVVSFHLGCINNIKITRRLSIGGPEYTESQWVNIEDIRPYLFPMSSMTKDQKTEFLRVALYEVREEDCGRHKETYYYDLVGHDNSLHPNYNDMHWLDKNKFDYRELIPKGLAIDCTNLNIY